MKRRRQMITLVSVLALLIVGIVAVRILNPTESQEDSSVPVFSVNVNELTALSWINATGEISFVRENGNWEYAEDGTFPLDKSIWNQLLESVCNIEAARVIEKPQALSEYGLTQPACTIRMEAGGKVTELLFGIQTGASNLHYLSNGDGKLYLVDSALYNQFARGLLDMVEKEQIPSVTLAYALQLENGKRSLEIEWSKDKWYLKDTQTVLDAGKVESLLDTFSKMTWSKCVAYNADATALEKYGLDVPGAVVEASYIQDSQQQTFRLELGDTTENGCYARLAGSKMVYLVDNTILNAANTEQETLLAE